MGEETVARGGYTEAETKSSLGAVRTEENHDSRQHLNTVVGRSRFVVFRLVTDICDVNCRAGYTESADGLPADLQRSVGYGGGLAGKSDVTSPTRSLGDYVTQPFLRSGSGHRLSSLRLVLTNVVLK
ncbi:hypothetical protein [Natronorubrum sp. DTA7]|uniref:hypothetical protein n=1 Tax=Natronorubrum sp. DTA7 TaxID=3447016 RepID=UPI003F8618D7